jgi:NUMOD4 motif/HNH endonuclease
MDQLVTPSSEPERWLPVVGWEVLYEVSDLGRVRSLPRLRVTGPYGGGRRWTGGNILRPALKAVGYLCVTLCNGAVKRTTTVHSLVAEAFLGPRPDGYQVCHGPAGPLDNRLVNLSYGTRSKNCGEDRYRDGTQTVGTRHGLAKLTDEIVRECRARVAAGETRVNLAREFGVNPGTIAAVVNRRTWRHVA